MQTHKFSFSCHVICTFQSNKAKYRGHLKVSYVVRSAVRPAVPVETPFYKSVSDISCLKHAFLLAKLKGSIKDF